MKLFSSYLKTKGKTIAVFLFFSILFGISFALCRIPAEVVLYPFLMCVFFGILFVLLDFFKLKKRHKCLTRVSPEDAELFSADTVIEEDCQKIIAELKHKIECTKAENYSKYCEMTDYYTVWAHQIKTPIASMKLTLQNEDSPLSRKLRAELFRIQQYVEMVLAFLRLDSESSDYLFAEHSVDAIARECVKKFASEFIGKKLTLDYRDVCISAVTDEKWLAFVIEQILSNALKYTNEGGISIYDENKTVLCIADTGIGIAKEDIPRIFEKGYTGYNGRNDKSATGLGLYLCKRVCDNLGIKISITSSAGKGTLVRLAFPDKNVMAE